MRTLFASIALAANLGMAQELPCLARAVGLDVRVKSAQWNSNGDALYYSREESGGIGIGVFRMGDLDGKVLLHVPTGDRWDAQWFESDAVLGVIVYKEVTRDKKPQTEASIYLLNAKTRTTKCVFRRMFPPKEKIKINMDVSPSLLHGIFTVSNGTVSSHFVLPPSGSNLVYSRDLDAAAAKGISGPFWSVDGTAVYQANESPVKLQVGDALIEEKVAKQAELTFSITLSDRLELVSGKALNFWIAHPAAGTPVLELMPSNSVLREVRIKGSWVPPKGVPTLLDSTNRDSILTFGPSQGYANSLWLKRGDQVGERGVLVAAHADKGWMAPRNQGIAYRTDGALFVRLINP